MKIVAQFDFIHRDSHKNITHKNIKLVMYAPKTNYCFVLL